MDDQYLFSMQRLLLSTVLDKHDPIYMLLDLDGNNVKFNSFRKIHTILTERRGREKNIHKQLGQEIQPVGNFHTHEFGQSLLHGFHSTIQAILCLVRK